MGGPPSSTMTTCFSLPRPCLGITGPTSPPPGDQAILTPLPTPHPKSPKTGVSSGPAKQRVFLHRSVALRGQTLLSWPAPCVTAVFLKKGPSSVWFPQEVGLGGSLVVGVGGGRAGRGGSRAPLNSAAPAWFGRHPDRGRADAAGTAPGPGGMPVQSDGACTARPGPQCSPSPASARTGPRGWSRSAEASEPCSLECRHSPAFASCRLWAGRAWAEAGQEENRGLVKKSAGSPRSL